MRTFKQFIDEMVTVSHQQATRRLEKIRKPVDTDGVIYPPGNHPHEIALPTERSASSINAAMNVDDRNAEWAARATKKDLGKDANESDVNKRRMMNDKNRRLSDVLGVKPNQIRQSATHSGQLSNGQHLHFSQSHNNATDSGRIADKTKQIDGHIRIQTVNDGGHPRHVVVDGHHALVGQLARGYNPMVVHRNLNDEEETLRKSHPKDEPKLDNYDYASN